MHSIPLLVNIAVALVVAFAGGLAARRLGLPPIVGYLLAGVAIGPFTPGFVGDIDTLSQLAELGVIFLMFGVGLHFSLRDLWQVRDIAIPGALLQTGIATVLGYLLTQAWGWTPSASIVLGLAISVASTVVLLRGLMDNGLLNTHHGRVAVGWLVLEDLATVLILVVLPTLAPSAGGINWANLGLTLLKVAVFTALMLFVGGRAVPWLLLRTAHTRSRELFILAVLALALGTALGAAELFGVSFALGAFLAGVIVGESPLSHQVGADLVPFREAFSVLFFVSVGMLVNPAYLLANASQVALLSALVVAGKAVLGAVITFLFPHPARTALVVGAGLSQIGEFSFIVGQAGLALGLLNRDQYSLILAGALVSITLNPLMFRLIEPAERWLRSRPALWARLNRHGPETLPAGHSLQGHVVVVGWGRVGHHIVDVLNHLGAPRLVIEADAPRVEALRRLGVPTLFGDAANSEVMAHAHLERARALVVTLPDEAASQVVVAAARRLAPNLPIIARAATQEGVAHLAALGAQDVVHPELAGGLEIVRSTLLRLGYLAHQVEQYANIVRREHYDLAVNTPDENRILRQLISAARDIDLTWVRLGEGDPLVGQTLAQADLRAQTGASVVALYRDGRLLANPKSQTVFQSGDHVGLIGEPEQIAAAFARLTASGSSPPAVSPAAGGLEATPTS
ncbi:MAG: cation:proton antiporter [Anaerolineales bacterium]|nr:cation:proton antiporter [Anaerolineales bacterium]